MSNVFSNLKLNPLNKPAGKLLAGGEVLIGGVVAVRFNVLQGSKGVFASLPSRKTNKQDEKTGKDIYRAEVKIPDKALYEEFQSIVQKAWAEMAVETPDTGSQDDGTF